MASRARNMGIDIAVDLKGFTQDYRAGSFARRAAPVQVNYLGYPVPWARPTWTTSSRIGCSAPAETQAHYAEKIIYLPHSYQVNDTKRGIAEEDIHAPGTWFTADGVRVLLLQQFLQNLAPPL